MCSLPRFAGDTRSLEIRPSGLSANGYSRFSDERLKSNVEDLDSQACLSLVKSVKAKSYVRTDIEGSAPRIGFIAQHIQKSAEGPLCSLIGEADGDNTTYLTVDYPKLTSVLWSVCQNLISRVEELESFSKLNAPSKRKRS